MMESLRKLCGRCCGWTTYIPMSIPLPFIKKKSEEKFLDLPQAELSFCASAFLPECVRNTVREIKLSSREQIPFCLKMPVVLLTCEMPAIPEVIDMYSMSNSCSIVDVIDELDLHVTGIMRTIVVEGGDIITFTNGFLDCIWPSDNVDIGSLSDHVLRVALRVQEQFGATETKLGCILKNVIGISVGEMSMFFVGTKKVYYVVTGEILIDARAAAYRCGNKEVVTTAEFWNNLKTHESYSWQTTEEHFITVFSTKKAYKPPENKVAEDKHELMEVFDSEFGSEINKYIHPLHKSARTKQQLQILTSMTQTVAISVRILKLDIKTADPLHLATNLVYDIVEEYEGIMTKIMYESDIVICILFGYPGFKHRDDAVKSILCAQHIVKTLKENEMKVSLGVSAGLVFCGILGPPLRQEICVLGMAVHISANLVAQYPEFQLVCCINTFFRTCRKLGNIFTALRKRMRNVKSTNIFFEVLTEPKKTKSDVVCVGRHREKEMVMNALSELKEGMEDLDIILPLINITGMMGIGKSILVDWVLQEAEKIGFRHRARVSNYSFEEPYSNAWNIVKQILSSSSVDSEAKIRELLGEKAGDYPLHLLNKHFNTTFSYPVASFGEEDTRNMMVQLIKESAKDVPALICLDNAHHVGTESWLVLQSLLITKAACLVTTFSEEFQSSVPFVKHILKQQYLGITLAPYTEKEIGALSCHVLNVKAIHKGFLDFLKRHSEGNALRLQEMLMLPPLQKHFCLVPYVSVTESTLRNNFYLSDEIEIPPAKAKVCDILDADGLMSIKIPKHLLDVIKDHTTGLDPEEQMLMKKCSMLGDTFGLYILEAVCPEYPIHELLFKTQKLVEKNILRFVCHHLVIKESGSKPTIGLLEVPTTFCLHPLKFSSDFLKKCVLNSLAETQRERLNLYLADLLRSVTKSCDSCKRDGDSRRSTPYHGFFKNFRIPNVDMRLCQCLNLQTSILMQVEFHLLKGNAEVSKRIDILLEAAETGLEAQNFTVVEDILNKAIRFSHKDEEETDPPDIVRITIQRLRAELKLCLGKNSDGLRHLKHAMMLMGIIFPTDIVKKKYRQTKYSGYLAAEELKCLAVGAFVLKNIGDYKNAMKVGALHIKLLQKCEHSYYEIIKAKSLLLSIVVKTDPSKRRERLTRRLINQVRQQCFKRLMEYPLMSIPELRYTIRAFHTIVTVLFLGAELEAAEELGRKGYQLLKLIKHQKRLARLLFFLTHIYFYQNNYEKCFEMISQLQDAYQQSGDDISEAIYYTALVKVLREADFPGIREDKVHMITDYANKCCPLSMHPKNFTRIFCLSSKMALWAREHELEEAFNKWYEQATELKKQIKLDNYFAVSGSIYLANTEISKVREKFFVYTKREVTSFKQKITKEIENIQKHVKNYVPILERDVKQTDLFLQDILEECTVLNE